MKTLHPQRCPCCEREIAQLRPAAIAMGDPLDPWYVISCECGMKSLRRTPWECLAAWNRRPLPAASGDRRLPDA